MSLKLLKVMDKYFFSLAVLLLFPFAKIVSLFWGFKTDRIIFIKLWAMGDCVNTLPLIKAVKEKYPSAKIDVLVKASEAPVFSKQEFIDDIIIFNSKKGVLGLFLKYDLAFDLEPFANFSALIAAYCAGKRAGFSHSIRSILYDFKSKFRKDQHIVRNYFDLLSCLKIRYPDWERKHGASLIPLKYSKKAGLKVNALFKQKKISTDDLLIGFCAGVGASVKEREWPREKYRELGRKILAKRKDLKIILIGTKEDGKLNEFIQDGSARIISLGGQLSLEELFCAIERMKVFISNDTGPLHVAAAQGVRTIGLFGPNTPAIWGPFGKGNAAIFHPKRGCPFLDNTKHELTPRKLSLEQRTCMDAIKVDEVLKKAIELSK